MRALGSALKLKSKNCTFFNLRYEFAIAKIPDGCSDVASISREAIHFCWIQQSRWVWKLVVICVRTLTFVLVNVVISLPNTFLHSFHDCWRLLIDAFVSQSIRYSIWVDKFPLDWIISGGILFNERVFHTSKTSLVLIPDDLFRLRIDQIGPFWMLTHRWFIV